MLSVDQYSTFAVSKFLVHHSRPYTWHVWRFYKMAGARVCVQTTQMTSAGRVQVSQRVQDLGVQTQVVKTVDEQHRNVLGPDL